LGVVLTDEGEISLWRKNGDKFREPCCRVYVVFGRRQGEGKERSGLVEGQLPFPSEASFFLLSEGVTNASDTINGLSGREKSSIERYKNMRRANRENGANRPEPEEEEKNKKPESRRVALLLPHSSSRTARILVKRLSILYGLMITSSIPALRASLICPSRALPV